MIRPSQKSILLVRHGPTQWNLESRYNSRTDLPLLDGEVPDFQSLHAVAQKVGANKIISSPQRRAIETAELLVRGSSVLSKQYDLWSEIRETDFGAFEGMTKRELEGSDLSGAYSEWMLSKSTCYDVPHGESWNDIQSRVELTFSRLASLSESVILVSHGYFIRCLVGASLGLPPEVAARSIQTENYCVYRMCLDQDDRVKLASPLFFG